MKTNFSDRITKVLEYLNMSTSEFERETGLSNGMIGKAIKRNASLNTKSLEKIGKRFPRINVEWLATGQGDMLNKQLSEMTEPEKDREILSLEDKYIKLQEDYIDLLKKYSSLLERSQR